MRRVAAYNKRHLAQEQKAKEDTNSNSYKSLKNWVSLPLVSKLCRDRPITAHEPTQVLTESKGP